MKDNFNDVFALYNFIKNGEGDIASLSADEISALFDYLCKNLEQGIETDNAILAACAERIEIRTESTPKEIINRTYNRLNIKPSNKRFGKIYMRRILVAAMAALTFVVSSFITASALGVDIVKSVKTVFGEQNAHIQFVDYGVLDSQNNPATQRYDNLSAVFEENLPEYIYPLQLPDGITPCSVVATSQKGDRIFTLKLNSDTGDPWLMYAEPADKSYLPMGYTYNGEILRFVYTMSRKGEEITKYTVYTVHNGIQYTLFLHTGDWNEVLIILNSLVIK